MSAKSTSVLYITYDGLLEPLGQSQVLAYQEKLATDRSIHILSFEKADDWNDADKRNTLVARMKKSGIHWHPRHYHKRPSALATAYDIVIGTLSALWLVLRYRLRIVHARSYVPSVMALVVKQLTGAKYIFDMRGFWADERVDGGLWPRDGRMFRVAKWFEKRFLLSADHVVSLTHAAVYEMEKFPYLAGKMPPITVIPTCADLARFRPMLVTDKSGFTLGYVGSAGTWYLFDAVAEGFKTLLEIKPEAKLLIVNRGEHAYIRDCLRRADVHDSSFRIMEAEHTEIPALMSEMDAGIFFIKSVFSKQASAPTKLAEFLGCGVPCLGNEGVGDMAKILELENVGIAVTDFDKNTLKQALQKLVALTQESDIQVRCVSAAEKHFSLEIGVSNYREIYQSLEEQQ
jgi:glycosyltransferase involved in cell wall biosynthesis